MKLHEIKNIHQLDEGMKEKLAAMIIGALISATAHGGTLDKNETQAALQKMTPVERTALKTDITHSEVKMDFQDYLKKEAEAKKVSPEVKKDMTDKIKLKKITDEIRKLIKD